MVQCFELRIIRPSNILTQEVHVETAIEATALEKSYGKTKALDGLGFSVPEGSIFGLLGPNGAGKSTAVKILTTLTTLDAGSARVAGLDVMAEPAKVRRAIGVVGQKSGVDEEATGRENLGLQGRLYGLRGPKLRSRVDDLLERFGLSEAADRRAKGYSGGMQRRLDIAMGLINEPRVLFLDEPTTGLDPEIRSAMWQEIRRLNSEHGLAILLTTHYLEEADELAERLAFVDSGRIVVEGTPAALKAELRGDTVQIELDAPQDNGAARAAMERVGRVNELHLSGSTINARVDDGAVALPALLASLSSAAIGVASATVARPTLDDVYLRYTGRSFEEAERKEAA
jgi:ABC-2 type transport system ATP-binding protein